ncbi:hypothetical protein F8M41_021030 [Gigaspora margarita]|uniref:Retinoic acid induced 16-like protein n=1 Tax=Gigaspora margarita TaxID=4874 RepID=A0A8H4B1N5_GIGMA|nr:hypothetical protein F8M41_021030 [Gigaspora margarita]
MFLSKVMNNAVEIIVPHIKTKVEKLAEEWKCIQSFYNSSKNKDFSKSKFFSKELSNHLENMIRYIKEEDIRIRMPSNHFANRHCIDFILGNNVLLCLVKYAKNHTEFPMFSILLNCINIPGQIGRVSREALSMIILLCFNSGRNSRRNSSHQIDNINKQYSESGNINSSNQINSINKPSVDDTEPINTSSEATIEEFFELWAFVNKICEMDCVTIITKLVDVIINGFFKHSIVPALLSPMDDQATTATSYLTEIIKSIKLYPILDRILALLLGTSLDLEIAPDELLQQYMDVKKTTQMASLREILIERGASSEDRLSLATLKLFDSILESFNQFGLLSLMPQENQPSTPTSISLVVELAKKLDDEFGYEDYFLDAQSQVLMVSLACEHWSNPYPTIPSSLSSSNTKAKARSKFFDGTFITMIFEQLESFLEMPMERNLVLTNIIIDILEKIASDAKLGATKVPNFQTRIQLAKRRGMSSSARMPFHRSSRSTSISSSTPVSPIFTSPTHSRTPSTVSSKKSIELTSIYSLTSEPTSAHYKDNTINPFAKFTNFVNAFIVLQEFCKELAAIQNYFDNQEVWFNDDSSNINNISDQVKNNTLNDDVLLTRNSKNFAKLVRDSMSDVI